MLILSSLEREQKKLFWNIEQLNNRKLTKINDAEQDFFISNSLTISYLYNW